LSILSLILLIPINIANADDQAYDYGFEEGVAAGVATDDSSLITEAFLPLGTYLLFVGIFISAKNISRDTEVRKELYNSPCNQLTLLKTIGVSQMKKRT